MRIDSTVLRWRGYVVLPSYMTFPQLVEWESISKRLSEMGMTPDLSLLQTTVLPMICGVVKEWHIEELPENMTPELFPGSAELLQWLLTSILKLFESTNMIDPNS